MSKTHYHGIFMWINILYQIDIRIKFFNLLILKHGEKALTYFNAYSWLSLIRI